MSSKHQIGRVGVFHLQNHGHITTENDFPGVQMTFWYKFEKRWANVFQICPKAIHFNPRQFYPSLSLLSFPVFCLSCSIVLSRYFVFSVNSMTIWSMLKLPKIAWPSPVTETDWNWVCALINIQLAKKCKRLIGLWTTQPRLVTPSTDKHYWLPPGGFIHQKSNSCTPCVPMFLNMSDLDTQFGEL